MRRVSLLGCAIEELGENRNRTGARGTVSGDYRRERSVLAGRYRNLGGPGELACVFERRGQRDDAGAGIQLAPSVGQRFGDRVCFNRRRVRYGLFRPCGRRIAEWSKRLAKGTPREEGAATRGIASRLERTVEPSHGAHLRSRCWTSDT
jgi:hypothetical protein